MSSFNQVTIVGNATRDVELKHIPSGTAVCEIGVAVNEKYKGKDGKFVDKCIFVDVTAWGRLAEIAAEYVRKGSCILISGKLSQQSWDDKQTGQKRSKLVVVAENMQFLGGNEPRGERSEQRSSRKPAEDVGDPVGQFPDDDVPF